MKKHQGTFASVMLILGTVIGAGFASGQEIVVFFAQYGFVSIIFAFLFFILFSYGIFEILKYGKFKQKNPDFIKEYPKNCIFDSFEGIIFLIFSSTMIAGAEQLLTEFVFPLPFKLWSILILLLAVIISSKGLKWIIATNKILVPMVVIFSILVCALSFFFSPHSDFTLTFDISNFAFLGVSATLYATCNLMVVNKITNDLSEKLKDKNIKKVAITCGAILFGLITLIVTALLLNDNSVLFTSLPMIYLAYMISKPVGNIYCAVILLCIFTTLTSTFYSLNEGVKLKLKYKKYSIFISAFAVLILSLFGFDLIIRYSYPLIGALGIILLFSIKNRMTLYSCGEKSCLK